MIAASDGRGAAEVTGHDCSYGTHEFLPSLTQLRAFREVARLDSISQAALRLRRSQSAVTQSVQKLEEQIGVNLFARTSTGSYVAEIGRHLERGDEECFARIRSGVERVLVGSDPWQVRTITSRVTRGRIVAPDPTRTDRFRRPPCGQACRPPPCTARDGASRCSSDASSS